MAITSLLLNT